MKHFISDILDEGDKLIKCSQNCKFTVFYFGSLEVATAALDLFCGMISSLVDTSLDFGLF